MFVGRTQELRKLDEAFESSKASFAVVYGRRRVGKTELLHEFQKKREGLYFLSTYQNHEELLKQFSLKTSEFLGDEAVRLQPFTKWDAFLTYLANALKKTGKKTVVVFDEFTYLIEKDEAVPSIIQSYWDQYFSKLPIMLVLCGSYVGMMEKEVLGIKSPLYGRSDLQIQLTELSFKEVSKFYPKLGFGELLKFYSITGGIPAYLLKLDEGKSFEENLLNKVFDKTEFLYNDARALILEEVKEPRNYFSILRAISFGKNTQKEISDFTGILASSVGKYLDVLKGMRLIKRTVPVTENPEKSRRGTYELADNYYSFWFRFVEPNADLVENQTAREYLEGKEFKEKFNTYLGKVFENVCKEYLIELNKKKAIEFNKIGKYWLNETEIDWLALGEKQNTACECKYSNKIIEENDLLKLEEKTQEIREMQGKEKKFVFFSKSGFTKKATEYAAESSHKWILVNKELLEKWISS